MTVNQQQLKQAWDVSEVSTKEEWNGSLQQVSVEDSSSHAIRACRDPVEVHQPLAKEPLNAAFISCWGELYDQHQVRIYA